MANKPNRSRPHAWRWESGTVDKDKECFELRYGDINIQSPEAFLPVALIAAPRGTTFIVQFLLDPNDSKAREIVEAVKRELDFYLVEKGEPRPWEYAKYHCSTAANLYSDVHWLYHPRGCKASRAESDLFS